MEHMIRKYTYEYLKDSAKKYKSKSEWCRAERCAYNAALHKPFYCEITSHMKQNKRGGTKPVKWTKDVVLKLIKKCSSRTEFQRKYKTAYVTAQRKGFLYELYAEAELECLNANRTNK